MKKIAKKYFVFDKNLCFFILSVTMFGSALAQSPGGIPDPINLWLKANAGTNTMSNGGGVSFWSDQGSNNDAIQSTVANQPSYVVLSNNYNPGIYSNANVALIADKDFLDLPDGTLPVGNSPYTVFCVVNNVQYYSPFLSGGINQQFKANRFSVGPNGETKNSWNNFGADLSTPINPQIAGASTIYCVNYNMTDRSAYVNGEIVGTNTDNNFDCSDLDNKIGVRETGGGIFEGEINEIIIYHSSLGVIEQNKITSYLAVKYGITLNNIGGGDNGDYLSTDGATIWDADDAGGEYHNDVIGIGDDNNQALLQHQSHTQDDTTRIYLGTLASDNVSNVGSFLKSRTYKMVGHNKGKMCATVSSNTEVPVSCGLYSRLEREWRVQKRRGATNHLWSLDLKLGTCSNLSLIHPNDLRLLVDDDGDFSNGGTNCYMNGDQSGIIMTYNNPVLTIGNIPDSLITTNGNATRFLTIGSVSVATPLPVGLTSFTAKPTSGMTAAIEWETSSEVNSDYFVVEKSRDNNAWTKLNKVPGAGNSSNFNSYNINDRFCEPGNTYYRLKHFDFDGDVSYSPVKKVFFDNKENVIIYPNPANDQILVSGAIEKEDISLFNCLGQEIYPNYQVLNQNEIKLEVQDLPEGIYLVVTGEITQKIIIKH